MNPRSVLECGPHLSLSNLPPRSPSARELAQSKTWRLWPICFCFLLSTFCFRAWGQYSIDWSTIDGGGGASTGGVYSVSGTIGQPDAGAMSGGQYLLSGGFWSVFAVQTPGAPPLSIARSNAAVIVSWPLPAGGWVLVSATNMVSAPQTTVWTPVSLPYQTNSTTVSVTEPLLAGRKFYRLRQP